MPQFGNKTAPRKLVDTVVYDDFNDFIDTSRENQGHSIGLTNNQDSTYKNNKHQVRKNQDDQQTPVVLSPSHTAPETSVLPSQLHKPDDAVNQVATQSLLSSLNMVPMAAFAKSLAGTSPPSSSSVVSDRSQSTSVSYQHQSPTSIMSPVQKISTANQGFKMPFPMPKPSICTSDNNSNYDNINGSSNNGTPFLLQQEMDGGFSDNEKGITPTKTLVPVLPDVTAMDSTMLATSSNSSPMITHHQEHQVTSPPAERLQKPMEHEHTVPIITNGNNSHANAYDGPVIKSVATGAVCPVLSAQLLSRLIQITKSETGLNDSMIIENAAHAATSITFKAIGGQRRVQQKNHNDAPIVVILAGNHSVGCYGIATARHLANRGIQVVVLLASTELGTQVKEQKRCAQFAGVTFVDGIDELPDPLTAPVDLIIDALMGSVITMVDLKKNQMDRTLLWQGIDWANGNKAPVLSLDYPSGVNSEDGHPFHVMHYILPKWTLCFGAPIEGCVSNKVTGGLFVADLGIPAVSWQRIGIKKRGLPWGAESVMPLEYE
ncbi:YjeF N-terminal domain-containing protein [Chlamydoabsidia padenii]|nr:YjeF N-terminal domain-containing protein [Chlamydoabsidia padenii]